MSRCELNVVRDLCVCFHDCDGACTSLCELISETIYLLYLGR